MTTTVSRTPTESEFIDSLAPIEDKELERIKHLVSPRALAGETMLLNMGPQHPSTHGVLRVLLELDGETIVTAVPNIGYLHTGVEKTCEDKTYNKVIPLTDRLDYLSPLSNNLAYCLAVEKLMDVEVPLRAQYIRVLLNELSRISSHMVWWGTSGLEMGALSTFLYAFREREYLLDIFEMCSGQRMMTSYFRIGGLWRDVPEEFEPAVRDFLDYMPDRIREYERLLKENPIWKERTIGVGVISSEEAIQWSLSGPSLRGSGVNWDIRKVAPYSCYDHFEFDVPVGTNGDVYDRYRCRMLELWESLRIVEQALDNLPGGPVIANDRKVVPPPKEELAYSMEAVIHHFKLWTEGFRPPKGEVYVATESPRGEYGVYINSDGTGKPRRVHFRTPTFANLQSLPIMTEGLMVSDIVAIIGSIDLVLGDVDR
jgi:NADH-quinone oxidoreductase subunit D